MDDGELSSEAQTPSTAPEIADEPDVDDDLLEEIELDVPDEAEDTAALPEPEQFEQPGAGQTDDEELLLSEDEQILVETDNTSEPLVSEHFGSDVSNDELTDSQIASLVEDESFDRTELDAFAEALALETGEQANETESAQDEQASELLSAELDELLQQVEAVDPELAETGSDEEAKTEVETDAAEKVEIETDTSAQTEPATTTTDDSADELADDTDISVDSDGPDLQNNEDDSVTKPSEAALSVENPSKMLDSYPELELSDEDFNDEQVLDDDAVSVEISPADEEADQNLAKLDDSQFDNLLTELEAMAQTTASDSEELNLDVDDVFSPSLDEDEITALSDNDFVEIDNLLASSEQVQEDDGRFEQLNVDVGLDEFADVIGNDNPQDVDTEDNGFAAKLDLVRAYFEIDDLESAGQIISEVMESDAPEHVKAEAKALQEKAK